LGVGGQLGPVIRGHPVSVARQYSRW
jgi:hypothetical protein